MRETDSLLKELQNVNQQLLAADGADLDRVVRAVEHRGRLATRVGRLLRHAAKEPAASRDALEQELDQALDTGDIAVRRILSLSADHPGTYPVCTYPPKEAPQKSSPPR